MRREEGGVLFQSGIGDRRPPGIRVENGHMTAHDDLPVAERSWRCDVMVVLGLYAVLFNLIAGILVGFLPAGATGGAGRILICTADGLRLVDPASRTGEGPSSRSSLPVPHCVLCLPVMDGATLPVPISVERAAVIPEASPPFESPDEDPADGRHAARPWPRGPPGAGLV